MAMVAGEITTQIKLDYEKVVCGGVDRINMKNIMKQCKAGMSGVAAVVDAKTSESKAERREMD
eukprot:5962284-Alexandrium_andersonii.AAC.1